MTARPILIEAAVESAEGAVAAARCGAERIELCANLSEGGTTPSAGTIEATLARVGVPVFVMIRPRGGDFLYSDIELDVMARDIAAARSTGAHGIVTGVLRADGTVDVERLRLLIDAAGPLPVTFHRAFDLARDLGEALDALIECGIPRVLTSGGKPRAADAIPEIAGLVRHAGGRLIVMPGGGIKAVNAVELIERTGAREIHVGGTRAVESGMRYRREEISFARPPLPDEYTLTVIDEARLRDVIGSVRKAGIEGRGKAFNGGTG
jgi:copper homeostasis protein